MSRRVPQADLDRRARIYQRRMLLRSMKVMEIAALTGVPHSAVSRIVNGRAAGTQPRVVAICKVLGLDLSAVMDPEARTSDDAVELEHLPPSEPDEASLSEATTELA